MTYYKATDGRGWFMHHLTLAEAIRVALKWDGFVLTDDDIWQH